MSIVAVKILDKGFEMSADSQITRWTTIEKVQKCKMFEVNDVVIGGVGTAEYNSLMRLYLQEARIRKADELSMLEFISGFYDWIYKKTNKYPSDMNHYLIGYEFKVFSVEGFHIQQVEKYQAIGSGMDYALAALYLGHSTIKAVKTACELNIYCEEPIVTIRKEVK